MTTAIRTDVGLRTSFAAQVHDCVDRYPFYDEYDIAELLEERWKRGLSSAEFQSIRATYHRAKLQDARPEPDEEWQS